MPVLTPYELSDSARGVLDAVRAAAQELEVELPERQLVTAGAVVYDCELVAVTLVSINPGIVGALGDAMAELSPVAPVWGVTFGLAIVRTASERPVGPRGDRAPTPDMIAADADVASADAAVLLEAAYQIAGPTETGFPSVALQFNGVEGGLIATSLNLTLNPWLVP